jgi:hypothetical protein
LTTKRAILGISSSSFSFKDRTSAPIYQHISQDRVCQALFACPLSLSLSPFPQGKEICPQMSAACHNLTFSLVVIGYQKEKLQTFQKTFSFKILF